MICPICQTANEEDANFCLNCGHRLFVTCPRCSRHVISSANYCDRCGLALDKSQRAAAEAPTTQATEPPARPNVQARPSTPPQPAGPAAQSRSPEAALARFIPAELQRKLESARSSGDMVGERRIVTMLFCDLKGSTAAAEHLDPEEWTEIVNGAFEHMIKPVYRYEGTVARLMGDGILAFFGAPLAHEDDPQRAVMAGLDMVAAMVPYREHIRHTWGIDFNVRVGINTGLVVVGAVGSDLRTEYSALGDAINLAARMEQTAEPGTVRVAEETYKLVKPLFEFEALGPIVLKGKEEPVNAYRVLGRLAAGGRVRGIEGLHADMVGRESELTTLQQVIADLKQGVGRIVSILGEAGLGKSRLVAEVKHHFDELPGPDCAWYETSSLSYEAHHAYGLLQRLLRQICDIHYEDAPRIVRKKLSALAADLPEADQDRAQHLLEVMFGLAGENGSTPLEGDLFKDELFEMLASWLRLRFDRQPAVMVFDDMHWSDAASVDIVQRILPLTAELPLVIIAVMRAERQAPAWQVVTLADAEYRHRTTQITLRPLTESQSNELISRLLAIAEIPDGLRANILGKSEGNPFFIEEVVRTLIENGVVVAEDREVDGETRRYWRATSDGSNVSIPNNLQSLLAARMDQLEEDARATLQLASVIGRNFHLRVLQAVDENDPELDRHVAALVRLDMIRESARVPEIEYAFRNPLTQEAVYRTILLRHRRDFHRRVGEAIEELYATRLDGLYGLLAHHFTLAGEQAKAIEYCRLAARQSVAVYAFDEAAQNLHAALKMVTDATPLDVHMTLLEELGDVFRQVRDFVPAISYYQQAIELGQDIAATDRMAITRMHRKILNVTTDAKWSVDVEVYGEVSAASQVSLAYLRESLPELEAQPPQDESVLSLIALSVDTWRVQEPPEWDDAEHYAQAAVDMAETLDDPVLMSRALGALANVLDGRSLLRRHFEVAERRLEITQTAGFDNTAERVDALRGMGAARMYVGEYDDALVHLAEAENLARGVLAVDQVANAVGLRAQCYFRADHWDSVLGTETVWRDLERKYARERIGEMCFFVALSAAVYGLRGDYEQAEAYAEESYDYMVAMTGSPDLWQRNQFY